MLKQRKGGTMSVGEILKKLREEKGLKKSDVAKALNMPYTTYNNYETDTNDVGSETLRILANYFGVAIDYLLENQTEQSQGYYLDPETARIAQEMFDNPNMRILFDASRKATPEDLKKIAEMAKIMVGDEDEGC
jgi:transcriptional regulator with XRE-family HTH domain